MTLQELVSMRPPLTLDEELGNQEIQIVYYWYHHMLPSDERNAIQRSIDEHDYALFKAWRTKLNSSAMCYLPDEVYVYSGDDFIGSIPMGEQAFSLITYSECECG